MRICPINLFICPQSSNVIDPWVWPDILKEVIQMNAQVFPCQDQSPCYYQNPMYIRDYFCLKEIKWKAGSKNKVPESYYVHGIKRQSSNHVHNYQVQLTCPCWIHGTKWQSSIHMHMVFASSWKSCKVWAIIMKKCEWRLKLCWSSIWVSSVLQNKFKSH